jgi:hypothetical protein
MMRFAACVAVVSAMLGCARGYEVQVSGGTTFGASSMLYVAPGASLVVEWTADSGDAANAAPPDRVRVLRRDSVSDVATAPTGDSRNGTLSLSLPANIVDTYHVELMVGAVTVARSADLGAAKAGFSLDVTVGADADADELVSAGPPLRVLGGAPLAAAFTRPAGYSMTGRLGPGELRLFVADDEDATSDGVDVGVGVGDATPLGNVMDAVVNATVAQVAPAVDGGYVLALVDAQSKRLATSAVFFVGGAAPALCMSACEPAATFAGDSYDVCSVTGADIDDVSKVATISGIVTQAEPTKCFRFIRAQPDLRLSMTLVTYGGDGSILSLYASESTVEPMAANHEVALNAAAGDGISGGRRRLLQITFGRSLSLKTASTGNATVPPIHVCVQLQTQLAFSCRFDVKAVAHLPVRVIPGNGDNKRHRSNSGTIVAVSVSVSILVCVMFWWGGPRFLNDNYDAVKRRKKERNELRDLQKRQAAAAALEVEVLPDVQALSAYESDDNDAAGDTSKA